MGLADFASDPLPGLVLACGGLLSILIALYGVREDSYLDEVGTVFAFLLGGFALFVASAAWSEEALASSSLLILVVLGVMLFFKPLRGFRWAAVLSFLIAAAVAILLAFVLPSEIFGIPEWWIEVAVFFLVFGLLYAIFFVLETAVSILTLVLDWRPVIVLVGLVALAEGILVLAFSSSLGEFV